MRKPFYDSGRKSWRIQINRPDGSPQKVTLGKTKAAAYEKWRAMMSGTVEEEGLHCDCCKCRKRRRGPKRVDLSAIDLGCPDEFYLSVPEATCRFRSIERIMLVVELLLPLRRGATITELQQDVAETVGSICERTIRRDLIFLVSCGVVDQIGNRYRWHSMGTRSKACASLATAFSEEREVRCPA